MKSCTKDTIKTIGIVGLLCFSVFFVIEKEWLLLWLSISEVVFAICFKGGTT